MWLDQEAAQGNKVLDGDVRRQPQPVSAGNCDVTILQRTRQSMYEAVALSDQHHDVAGAQCALLAFQHLAAIEPLGNAVSNDLGKTSRRSRCVVDRLRPIIRLLYRDGT